MEKLSDQDIVNIANLAQLSLSEDEVRGFRADLEGVLAYFEQLSELDTEGVEEMGHITGLTNVYRTDRATELSHEQREETMQNVPAQKNGSIAVKSIL